MVTSFASKPLPGDAVFYPVFSSFVVKFGIPHGRGQWVWAGGTLVLTVGTCASDVVFFV